MSDWGIVTAAGQTKEQFPSKTTFCTATSIPVPCAGHSHKPKAVTKGRGFTWYTSICVGYLLHRNSRSIQPPSDSIPWNAHSGASARKLGAISLLPPLPHRILFLGDEDLLGALPGAVVGWGPVAQVPLDEVLDEVLLPVHLLLPDPDLARVLPDAVAVVHWWRARRALLLRRQLNLRQTQPDVSANVCESVGAPNGRAFVVRGSLSK